MMNKTEFMNRLKRGLDDFPREEQENALGKTILEEALQKALLMTPGNELYYA